MQENIPVEEVFKCLECTREGLNTNEVQERLDIFGYNKLEEKNVSTLISHLIKFVVSFWLLHFFSILLMFVGKQSSQVSRVYVESFILGDGSCSYNGHCSCSWRGKQCCLILGKLLLIILSCN